MTALLIITIRQMREFIIEPACGLYINFTTHAWTTTFAPHSGTLLRWDGIQVVTFDGRRIMANKTQSFDIHGEAVLTLPIPLPQQPSSIITGAINGTIARGETLYAYRQWMTATDKFLLQKNRTFQSEIKITNVNGIITLYPLLHDIFCESDNADSWHITTNQGVAIVTTKNEASPKKTICTYDEALRPKTFPRLLLES